MRNKLLLFCLFWVILIGFTANSCKKSTQNYIQTLFTYQHWQLASLQVSHYVGDTLKMVDTLNTMCNFSQTLTFNTNNTCTYTNFDCLQQSVTGQWSLSANQLNLMSDLKCQDTTAVGSSMPFQNAQIINLGQYSLVLQTGDLETFYPPNKVRVISRYGFIRVKTQ